MLSKDELRLIDDYFSILFCNAFCISVRSKNTGDEWHIVVQEGRNFRHFQIWHRHGRKGEFHLHGHKGSFSSVLKDIKGHDIFQLSGRKQVRAH